MISPVDEKINVEIWSDIACPFCYIGKRNFEEALEQVSFKDKVNVEWKSFQLMPDAKKEFGMDIYDVLAKKYGRSREWAVQANKQVEDTAKNAGLDFQLAKIHPTNTLDGHRLIHLASEYGLQDKAKERLLHAYFVEGKHVGDFNTLIQLGSEIGLDADKVKEMLNSDKYKKEVIDESEQGQSFGLTGVPFFVFNRKYAVAGAQPPETFLGVMKKIWQEDFSIQSEEQNNNVCSPDGFCAT